VILLLNSLSTAEIVHTEDPTSLDSERVRLQTRRVGFTILRGLIDPAEVNRSCRRLRDHFDQELDQPPTGHAASAVRRNFQKLTVGGESGETGRDDARFFRTFYNPIWDEDTWGLRSSFVTLARTRNRIAGLPEDYAVDRIESDGLWTAARVHQYPRGGGFFRRHTDHLTSGIASSHEVRYVQVLLVMSQKGRDFYEGGAFVEIRGERVVIDDVTQPGDVVVYDGRTVHGVEDIDPSTHLDLTTINGRLAAFVTLFESR